MITYGIIRCSPEEVVANSTSVAQLDIEFLCDLQSKTANPDCQAHQEGDSCDPVSNEPGVEGLDSSPIPALDRLVLPKGHRELMVSLISHHIRSKLAKGDPTNHFDVIQGKGRSLFISYY